ncbi:MAG: ribonuclease H-like domain-containing protein [Euryarchaeota archaeon]|nr:ribonuclease H-like domain-containing protein [Euryarchaeota archaeon]
MEFEGFLLDADYITERERAVVRLWCRDSRGRRRVVLDPSFEPYFYAVPRGGATAADLERAVGYRRDEALSPRRVEPVKKRLFGRPQDALRVVAHHPSHVPILREAVGRSADVFEADIPFGVRYMVDRGLAPLDGVRVSGEPVVLDYAEESVRAGSVQRVPRDDYPQLKVLAFDTEMSVARGMPNAERDPIVILSAAVSGQKEQLFTMEGDSDREVLESFARVVREEDPDVLAGYNSDQFDWPYLEGRAKVHKMRLPVGVDGSEARFRPGAIPIVQATGRQVVDLFRVVKRDLGDVKVKTLVNVADYLGILKKEQRVDLEPLEIHQCWEDPARRPVLFDYARADVVSTLRLAEHLLPMQVEFSRMTRNPVEEVSRMGRGRQVEAYLTAEAHLRGEMVPMKGGEGDTYEGGYVLEPQRGLHENVVCLDFSAMYPSIMIAYNISPDSVAQKGNRSDEVFEAPGVGHRFVREPDGFFKSILQGLVARRRQVKGQMEGLPRGPEAALLDVRQKTLKILTNAFYGYTGWRAARWYRRECAEATTAWGRHFIRLSIQRAQAMGFQVIYGDTDSLFLKAPWPRTRLLATATQLTEQIARELPLDLEIDALYKVIFFTEKKKRYAGLTEEGELVIRGLEVRRGDWCELARELQMDVIRILLEERDEARAVARVDDAVRRLRAGDIPLEKLVIWKTLTKPRGDYEAKQAHAEAASRAEEYGIEYEVGSKVPFLIVKGTQQISARSQALEVVQREKMPPDVEYYVHHQVLPAASRVLKHFGYDDDRLTGRMDRQQSLFDFQ